MNQQHEKAVTELPHVALLKALKILPFAVGKNLLIDFVTGKEKNKSIQRNNLHTMPSFNSLNNSPDELTGILENLITNNLIKITNSPSNQFLKILTITQKGEEELLHPSLQEKKINTFFQDHITKISNEEKEIFAQLGPFLKRFNDEQRKAIISQKKNILCIAAAGSGKTTVLTKRIEFLIRYKNVDPQKILAITFTRKARQEMQKRLDQENIQTHIETFNSFSEKILQTYGHHMYKREVRVMRYGDKAMALSEALQQQQLTMQQAIDMYFSPQQKNNKTPEELTTAFMNDCFFILEYLKSIHKDPTDLDISKSNDSKTKKMLSLCSFLKKYMEIHGLRDYTDQILNTIQLFDTNQEIIPKYEYILIDEYQDVNQMQIELISKIHKNNIFAVGDPRQSIFGWRGSDIKHIATFSRKYPHAEIISLTKNYRSSLPIINFINEAIKKLNLPDLRHPSQNTISQTKISIVACSSESDEHATIIQHLQKTESKDIFIVARTNRQIKDLSEKLKKQNIKHIFKTEDSPHPHLAKEDEITLATIHAIKGQEAHTVFVMGCNEQNFPSKTTDHPFIELIKIDEYDKEEEERRVLYVALSRAKQNLILTHTGKLSYFITDEMKRIAQ